MGSVTGSMNMYSFNYLYIRKESFSSGFSEVNYRVQSVSLFLFL